MTRWKQKSEQNEIRRSKYERNKITAERNNTEISIKAIKKAITMIKSMNLNKGNDSVN